VLNPPFEPFGPAGCPLSIFIITQIAAKLRTRHRVACLITSWTGTKVMN